MKNSLSTLKILLPILLLSITITSCTKDDGEEKKEELAVSEPKAEINLTKGKALYHEKCANCHGSTGQGDGPQADFLNPKPTNLSDVKYMSTLTDEHIFRTISEGGMAVRKSNLMPRWKFVLSKDDIWNVIAYIRHSLCKCEYRVN